MKPVRQAVTAAFAFAAVTTAMVVVAPGATAASTCTGTRIDSMAMHAGGRTAGRVELWYSSARGGTNCVMTYDNRAGSRDMGAFIDAGNGQEWDVEDWGHYTYYAGPVRLTNMAHHCVDWGGQMMVGSTTYEAFRWHTHCG